MNSNLIGSFITLFLIWITSGFMVGVVWKVLDLENKLRVKFKDIFIGVGIFLIVVFILVISGD